MGQKPIKVELSSTIKMHQLQQFAAAVGCKVVLGARVGELKLMTEQELEDARYERQRTSNSKVVGIKKRTAKKPQVEPVSPA